MKQKRAYKIFAGLLVSTTLLTTACAGLSDYDASRVESNVMKAVTITVQPESQPGGMRGIDNGDESTISKGKNIDWLIYALYEMSGSGTYTIVAGYPQTVKVNTSSNVGNDKGIANIEIEIEKGKTYKMAFWAQNEGCEAFETSDLQKVKVIYTNAKNNDELRDAFCANLKINGKDDSYKVTLKRPFAQINVGTTGADYKNIMKNPKVFPNMAVTQSKIELRGVAQYINVVTDEVDKDNLTNVMFDFATIPAFMNINPLPTGDALYEGKDPLEEFLLVDLDKDGKIKDYKTNYPTLDKDGHYLTETFKYLSMCYVLVPATTTIPDEMTGHDYSSVLSGVKVYFAETSQNSEAINGYNPITLNYIPVKRNWRTNILGGLKWMKDPTDPEYPNDPDPDDPEPPGPDDPTSVFGTVSFTIDMDPMYENGYIDWDDWDEVDNAPQP